MQKLLTIKNSIGEEVADLDVLSATITRRINDEFVLEFECFEQEMKTEYIESAGANILVDGNTFDIVYYEKKHDALAVKYEVEARHVFYRLKEDTYTSYAYSGTPTQILTNILSGTDFSVGTMGYTSPVVLTVNEQTTKAQLIRELAWQLGGEIEFSSNGFAIGILNTVGADNGFEVCFGKNLKAISKKVDSRDGTTSTSYDIDLLELKNSEEYICNQLVSLEVIELGDTIYIVDETANIDVQLRVIRIEYDPLMRKNTKIEIASHVYLLTDKLISIEEEAIQKGAIINGIKIDSLEGYTATRSDNKAKTIMNATEGISVYSDTGSGLERNFYVDVNGKIQCKEIVVDGSGEFNGKLSITGTNSSVVIDPNGATNIMRIAGVSDSTIMTVTQAGVTNYYGNIKVTNTGNTNYTEINATDGIQIWSYINSSWRKLFYVDTDGTLKARNLAIDSSGEFHGKLEIISSPTNTSVIIDPEGTYTFKITNSSADVMKVNSSGHTIFTNNVYIEESSGADTITLNPDGSYPIIVEKNNSSIFEIDYLGNVTIAGNFQAEEIRGDKIIGDIYDWREISYTRIVHNTGTDAVREFSYNKATDTPIFTVRNVGTDLKTHLYASSSTAGTITEFLETYNGTSDMKGTWNYGGHEVANTDDITTAIAAHVLAYH